MKKFLLLSTFAFLLFTFSLSVDSQVFAQSYPSWISNGHFPDASASSASAIAIDPSGNVMMAGSSGYNFVIKLNAGGDLLWLQSYDSEDTICEKPNTLCVDNQGNAYITFMKHTPGGGYWSIAVQKYDAASGTILWASELADAQFNGFEWQVKPTYMTIDNNHLYVAGTKFDPVSGDREMLAMKLDFNGNIIWTATHAGSGNSNSKSIAVDASGNVHIAGDAWNASIDYCVVKFDSNGNLVWDEFLDGDIYHNTDIAEAVLVDDAGNVYITGYNQVSSHQTDIVTAKYDQNGVFQWKQSYGNPSFTDNNAYYLAIANDGNLLVGGYSAYENPYPGSGKDYILLKYTPSGSLVWDARYDYQNFLNDHPFDFDKGPDGSVYICGITMKRCFIHKFITAVKVNPQGNIEWDIRVPNLYGTPWEIAVIAENEFVIAAGSFDTIQVEDATAIHYETGTPPIYNADILDVYFESQVAPPFIDYDNQRVTATVHDTANIEFLVPFITRSEHSCMYPDDEVVTSFIEPIWYNITSFDDLIEKWWIVDVEGGYVGFDENEGSDLLMYPNPAGENISLQSLTLNHQNMVVEIHDLNGRKLIEKHFKLDNETIEMDISKLKSGVYFYRLVLENKIITKKIIKQ
ncbi:MAG: T9SS type A sorting domain-containing protein [Bacteroidetes bacterium]|nr:T9SS type A sorting domain-containing protein [Bacteroidota bacterium]